MMLGMSGMLGLLLLAAVLRVLPTRLAPHGGGVDQWFWRAYIETARRTGRFPPDLPQFQLDAAQWYPPLFPLLLVRAPAALFERHAGRVAVLLDLLRMAMLMLATQWLSGSESAALLAGGVYALTPLLITYNMQLNPRGLGALFLDAMWLCVAAVLLQNASPWWWLVAAVLAGLVLLTHKMTTQLLVFTAMLGACMTKDVRVALLLPAAVLAALLLSGGFYRRVLQAHGDIIVFWYKNWRWSGSNPILESPIYGEPGAESAGKFYRSGWRPWLRRLQFVIGFNPWMPTLLGVGVLAWWSGHGFSLLELAVFAWLALTFAFALLTTLVPAFRCFGQGYLYGYNGSFPAAMALGVSGGTLAQTWYWPLATIAAALASVAALVAFFRALRSSRTMKVDADLDAAITRLAVLPAGTVMCLPQHWHDVVAYRTGKPVAFGGHGYGFERLAPVFPRLTVPVREFMAAQSVAYLLLWPAYANAKFLADLPAASLETFGDYQLYRFHAEHQAAENQLKKHKAPT